MTLTTGRRYKVVFRWKGSSKPNDFVGVYRGIKASPALDNEVHTFDLGPGARMYLGEARIASVEEVGA